MDNPYFIIIILSLLVVISYVFNIISAKIKVPSVILLLATGVGLGYFAEKTGFELRAQDFILELLGIVGLIFIVLEGSLDLHLSRKKIPLVVKSLTVAFLVLLLTTAVITVIFIQFIDLPFRTALIYAVPLGVISSSIAIPSVEKLIPEKREFIVYESTFSDILGIMLFNYVILENPWSGSSVFTFFIGLAVIIVISAVSSMLLLFLLNYVTSKAKFFLVFAVLLLVYSVAKLFHLPSLLLILTFGLMLNNANLFVKGKLAGYLHLERLKGITTELKMITEESAFLVRTFFFLLFGYSMNLVLLAELDVILIGSLVMVMIIVSRYVFLRFISRTNVFPELFIAPRGLITVVLFYSIPVASRDERFNIGILFFVIIVSALIMMFGLMRSGTRPPVPIREN